MILSRLPNVVCVMKSDLLQNLLLGSAARLARYVSNEPAVAMILRAVTELREGGQLLLFPEATRTTQSPLNPFTPATALIAQRAGVKVQTLFIETDSLYMTKGWSVFRQPHMPIHYQVRLGECFEPQADTSAFYPYVGRVLRSQCQPRRRILATQRVALPAHLVTRPHCRNSS